MYAEERRLKILELLKKKKRVEVGDLAERLETSPETIRRDLRDMESAWLLKRTHGGAIYADENRRAELPVLSRKVINYRLKARIAKKAASFIKEGDVIALDSSSTVLCLLEFIPRDLPITVVTNSLQVAVDIFAMTDAAWTCISLGGSLHQISYSTGGFLACETLRTFRPDKLFMSCVGLDVDGIMTEGNLVDAEIKRELIRQSRQVFLLLDAMKMGRVGIINVADVAAADYLVTNAEVERDKLDFLVEKEVELLFDSPESL